MVLKNYIGGMAVVAMSGRPAAKARSSGENCPICSNARIVAGINDLASLKPELLKEWFA